MKDLNIIISISIVFALASLAFGAWWFEINNFVGTSGKTWIYTFLYSPWLVALCTAFAVVTPFVVLQKVALNNRTVAVTGLLFIVSILSYYVGEIGFKSWFGGYVIIIPLIIANGLIFFILIHFLLQKISPLYILGVWLAIIGTYFFSEQLHYDFIDAVKLGYPFFFIVLNMGLIATLTAYFAKQRAVSAEFENILDAPL